MLLGCLDLLWCCVDFGAVVLCVLWCCVDCGAMCTLVLWCYVYCGTVYTVVLCVLWCCVYCGAVYSILWCCVCHGAMVCIPIADNPSEIPINPDSSWEESTRLTYATWASRVFPKYIFI
jgi:hypothetical protein